MHALPEMHLDWVTGRTLGIMIRTLLALGDLPSDHPCLEGLSSLPALRCHVEALCHKHLQHGQGCKCEAASSLESVHDGARPGMS